MRTRRLHRWPSVARPYLARRLRARAGRPAREPDAARAPGPGDRFPAIGDYALLGDSRCAALVSSHGSVDWLCMPRFDSPSTFAAILDRQRGGRFTIRPRRPFQVSRRYLPDTNILETTFRTESGSVRLLDAMTVGRPDDTNDLGWPQHELLRSVECLEGSVEIELTCEPRPHYGRESAQVKDRGALGWWWGERGAVVILTSEIALEQRDGLISGAVRLQAGERRRCSLSYSGEAPATVPGLGDEADHRLDASIRWWRDWVAERGYTGPYRDAVMRSALALRLLIYAPSGAIVAAPTTSLPERIGGTRNWDYRYAWLRDSSFVVGALMRMGAFEETAAFVGWMLHATALTQPRLRVLYDVFGRGGSAERTLPQLHGYRGSRPVRVGNGAADQLQLDVYGDVVDAVARWGTSAGRYDRASCRLLDEIGHLVTRIWSQPDNGIWESRAERKHYTESKVMCWLALDRLVRLHEQGLVRVCAAQFREEANRIRSTIERRGYSEALESYTQSFDDGTVDAALLRLPLLGYVDPSAPRMRSTFERIDAELRVGEELLVRYPEGTDDGVEGGEAAFGICSFWRAEYLARAGRLDEAERAFERLLGYANDVGLYAEEIDPTTGEALGNFPLGLTHVGLINAACAIEEARRQGEGTSEL